MRLRDFVLTDDDLFWYQYSCRAYDAMGEINECLRDLKEGIDNLCEVINRK